MKVTNNLPLGSASLEVSNGSDYVMLVITPNSVMVRSTPNMIKRVIDNLGLRYFQLHRLGLETHEIFERLEGEFASADMGGR
jgi:hypothetical protein